MRVVKVGTTKRGRFVVRMRRFDGVVGYQAVRAYSALEAMRAAANAFPRMTVISAASAQTPSVWFPRSQYAPATPASPPGYSDGYDAGRADWIAARRSEYAFACAEESSATYSGQYGRGYRAGWRWASLNLTQL